jgi:hypothetical protein
MFYSFCRKEPFTAHRFSSPLLSFLCKAALTYGAYFHCRILPLHHLISKSLLAALLFHFSRLLNGIEIANSNNVCVPAHLFCVPVHLVCVPVRLVCVPVHLVCVPVRLVCVPVHLVCVPVHSVCVPVHLVCVPVHSVCVPVHLVLFELLHTTQLHWFMQHPLHYYLLELLDKTCLHFEVWL